MAASTNQRERAVGGLWSTPGVPHKNWRFVTMDDLGAPDLICEMCERVQIRYVHHMEHPDYPRTLAVGCVCASNMEENSSAAPYREKQFKSRMKSRAGWLDRNWRETPKGEALNAAGWRVVVFKRGGQWAYVIQERDPYAETKPHFSPRNYATSDAAKMAAFDAFWELKDG